MNDQMIEATKLAIQAIFKEQAEEIIMPSDIDNLLRLHRKQLPKGRSLEVEDVEAILIDTGIYRKMVFSFPQSKEICYAPPHKSTYEVILALRPKAYFTHFSALSIHGLSTFGKAIYVNQEQKRKSVLSTELSQQAIRNAFSRPQRIPSLGKATLDDYEVFFLNGRQTGQLGVIKLSHEQLGSVVTTDVERTLIDSAVRPDYSGGVSCVLNSFKLAKLQHEVSVQKIVSYLKSLSYIYPYHQAIGFYMERSNVYGKETQIIYDSFPIEYDFYLGYMMKEVEYSPKWRIYFPRGLAQ